MIGIQDGDLLEACVKDLIIPSERVAHVQVANNLEHALLVLTKSGYTAIPVLDPMYKLHGLISTPVILDSILGLQRIEFEELENKKVSEIMNINIPRLHTEDKMKKGLELLIDHPFVCVENEEGVFEGILTRRAILKRVYSTEGKVK
ncbi:CBS domain-containing protein [Peribacillus cavernae]|uniref:CBS domain-containing protein n=1 Tax=Peribacillus cavernae TaxID=1674310 RepID=A0A433HPQ2_9BACI|nr:cyclic-di-AMP-binding protein CbpB [Peribacillus cavernae]MDQ0217263.1 putative transcriptional regulator [Peribacillus cavernae]RUQ30268.1 CBS domain-containing protein [Peribacillus cavernae]